MNEKLIVLGSGGFARQIPDLIRNINIVRQKYDLIGFLAPFQHTQRFALPILGNDNKLADIVARYVIGVGIPQLRQSLDNFATNLGKHSVILTHPQSTTQDRTDLSPGCILMAGARVNTGSTLGRHVLVNANAVVGHDCTISDHTVLSPLSMLGGGTHIGSRVLIGASAVTLPGIRIGDDAVIGAGAVVTDHVPAGRCAKGAPARW